MSGNAIRDQNLQRIIFAATHPEAAVQSSTCQQVPQAYNGYLPHEQILVAFSPKLDLSRNPEKSTNNGNMNTSRHKDCHYMCMHSNRAKYCTYVCL